ncbi:prenyltransferase [Ferroplasma sp.]|uniref:prenyltransferase n=1 Tax=Ferroplasma sp. TaxID=2591003 RepID=UPI00307D0908
MYSFSDYVKGLKLPLYFTSVSPVIFIWAYNNFKNLFYFVFLIAIVLSMQLALNLAMDFYDYQHGIKVVNGNTLFPVGPYLVYKMHVDQKNIRKTFIISALISIILGLYIIALSRDYSLIVIGILAVFVSLIYVLPPFRLDTRGFGEFSTFLSFGPFILIGSAILFNIKVTYFLISISILFGLLASAIRFLHHITEDNPDGLRVKNFKKIYAFILLAGFIIQLYNPLLFLYMVLPLGISIIHIVLLKNDVLKIAAKTWEIVTIQIITTLMVILYVIL